VEGCCHGELDKIYETLQHLEKSQGKKIDLLICCGDFQASLLRDPMIWLHFLCIGHTVLLAAQHREPSCIVTRLGRGSARCLMRPKRT
jgi:hypothetical protein